MKNRIITTYSFDELSQDAQQTAISDLQDINVDYDWWESVYEDAENIGAKITSFDMDRYCNMEFIDSAISIAEKIVQEHGEMCDTYKTAVKYLTDYDKLVSEQEQFEYLDEYEEEIEGLDNEFKKSIEEDYRILLSKEYDYLTSKEAIVESIKANDYEFLSTGKMY
jgi:hypothetical protein